jgi:hypothetical protein
MALAECAPGRFAHHGKGFGQKRIEAFPACQPVAELVGLFLQGKVGKRLGGGLQGVDCLNVACVSLQFAVIRRAEKPPSQGAQACHWVLTSFYRGAGSPSRAGAPF